MKKKGKFQFQWMKPWKIIAWGVWFGSNLIFSLALAISSAHSNGREREQKNTSNKTGHAGRIINLSPLNIYWKHTHTLDYALLSLRFPDFWYWYIVSVCILWLASHSWFQTLSFAFAFSGNRLQLAHSYTRLPRALIAYRCFFFCFSRTRSFVCTFV